MRKIALEEHFITHDLLKFTAQADFPSMQPKDAKNFEERLLDIGALRIEAMDLAGIDISVLSLTDPGLQGELPKDFAETGSGLAFGHLKNGVRPGIRKRGQAWHSDI